MSSSRYAKKNPGPKPDGYYENVPRPDSGPQAYNSVYPRALPQLPECLEFPELVETVSELEHVVFIELEELA
jgi:hypothetical protein